VRNPYADLRALLDATRQLDPEEMAELQLEQGYIDRALAIYEELVHKEPDNPSYETRRAWLARMLVATERTSEERVKIERPAPRTAHREPTLYGIPAPVRGPDVRRIVRVK
jgi:hypothetical protein